MSAGQKIFIARHGERADLADPSWLLSKPEVIVCALAIILISAVSSFCFTSQNQGWLPHRSPMTRR